MSRYAQFDTSRLCLRPLHERGNLVTLDNILSLDSPAPAYDPPGLEALADRVRAARRAGKPVLVSIGAHVIKQGCARFLIDLMQRGLISHIAGNGACSIHDFELSLIGATSENVADYIRDGRFGLWTETGRLNEIAGKAAAEGLGYGEAIGREIWEGNYPHRDISVLGNAWRLGIPATLHIGIGYDIVHQHPNFDGAATGKASHTDFLIFARQVEDLEGGVFLNFGSAVMGPEVYLKALSMARNVASREGREIRHFTTAVFDLISIQGDPHKEAAKNQPQYYYRPYKTILVRTVADGGESHYFEGDHKTTLPALWQKLVRARPNR
jgi:hypothetical protein